MKTCLASFTRLSPFLMALVLTGCGTSPIIYNELQSAPRLGAANDPERPFQYRGDVATLAKYTKIIIEPVHIYRGSDAQFGRKINEVDRIMIADYMLNIFSRTLGQGFEIVRSPAADAATLRLTLTGLERTRPVIAAVSHLTPAGAVVNTADEVAGYNGTGYGSVSYAIELSDSLTGRLLYAYVTKQYPDALDVTAAFGDLAAAKTGIRIGARHLLADIKSQGRS
jgi:hypothetical protein